MNTKRHFLKTAATTAALTAALIFSTSCGGSDEDKDKDKDSADKGGEAAKPEVTTPSGATGTPLATGTPGEIVGKNKHFQETVSHLDVGGPVFHYMDMDGDLAEGATKIDEILSGVMEMVGDELPPGLKDIKLRDLLFETGLENVKSVGLSSYEIKDGLFHNKMYVHIPGGREGLLKASGGKPGPLLAKTLAPADAVAVMEHDLNLKPILEVVTKMVEKIGNEEMKSSFAGGLASNAAGLGITVGDLFGKLDTKLTVIVSLNPEKKVTIPDAEIEIPEFDVLIVADNMGWLADKLEGILPPDMQSAIEKGDGFKRLVFPEPLAPGDMEIYKPVFHHDEKTDRLFIASRVEYLDRCLSPTGPRLTAQAEYQELMKGLPEEGNGLYYFSKDFWATYLNVLKTIEPSQTAQMEAIFNSKIMADIYKSGGAQVDTNLDRGWLVVSNYPQSHKSTLMGLALTPAAGLAIVAGGLAYPMAMNVTESAEETVVQSDLMTFEVALNNYKVNSGTDFPTTEQGLDALVRQPTAEPRPKRWIQSFARLPVDPWGQPYRYKRSPADARDPGAPPFDLWSIGPDGVDGTEDDIRDDTPRLIIETRESPIPTPVVE